MARANFDSTKPLIILDGNSLIQQGYALGITDTAFDGEYGAGTYDLYNFSVGGQDVDDVISRLTDLVIPILSRHKTVIYIAQLGRNQLLFGTSVADTLTKIETVATTLKAKLSTLNYVAVTTSASTEGGSAAPTMTDIPTLNTDVIANANGHFDYVWDLYNYSTFGVIGGSVFNSDYVHYSNPAGMTVHAEYLANQCVTQFPL